jgi:hypothetical protein
MCVLLTNPVSFVSTFSEQISYKRSDAEYRALYTEKFHTFVTVHFFPTTYKSAYNFHQN